MSAKTVLFYAFSKKGKTSELYVILLNICIRFSDKIDKKLPEEYYRSAEVSEFSDF